MYFSFYCCGGGYFVLFVYVYSILYKSISITNQGKCGNGKRGVKYKVLFLKSEENTVGSDNVHDDNEHCKLAAPGGRFGPRGVPSSRGHVARGGYI